MLKFRYGLENPIETMEGIHEVGQKTLEYVLQATSHPNTQKTLRTWGLNAAAELVARSTQSIRRLEKSGVLKSNQSSNSEAHITPNKRKEYTLSEINKMRDYFGTRYKRPDKSSPIIMPITNFKGGVSKTTTALLLSQKCAIDGLKILIIDLDPQATLTLLFGYIPDVHLSNDDTIATSLIDNYQDIHRVIKKTYFEGIDIIPGNSDLQQIELILPDNNINNFKKNGSPLRRLQNAIDLIKNNYDVIIIDCAPNLGALTMNAVAASNGMLIPIPPSMPDFGSFVRFSKTLVELFKRITPELLFFRILLSKHKRTNAANLLDTIMREQFGSYILVNHMVDTSEIDNTTSALCSIYEKPYGNTKTLRRALEAANAVNNEIISSFKEIWKMQASDIERDNFTNLEQIFE